MKSESFCYWLQGYFEIHGKSEGLSAAQVEIIKRHLAMVFKHEIDPSFPAEQQAELNAIHHGKPNPLSRPPRPDGVLVRC